MYVPHISFLVVGHVSPALVVTFYLCLVIIIYLTISLFLKPFHYFSRIFRNLLELFTNLYLMPDSAPLMVLTQTKKFH